MTPAAVIDRHGKDLLDDDPVQRLPTRTQVPKSIIEEARPQGPTRRVSPDAALNPTDLQAELKRMRSTNQASRARAHTLRLVMAGLDGLTFDEAATLLDVRPSRLAAWLHGETIPKTSDKRLAMMWEVLRHLHQLVPRANTGRWLRLPIPALGEVTPYEALVDGRVEDVLRVTQRYAESSFG